MLKRLPQCLLHKWKPTLRDTPGRVGKGRRPQGRAHSGNMAAANLAQILDVDIDCDSVFKYVLIRVHVVLPSGALARESKEIVSGYKWAEYHSDIYRRGISRDAEGL